MNHLIVVPRIVNNIGDWYQFPLGIAYVSACLKKAGFNIFTLNLNHINGSISEILKKEILDNNIDIVSTGGLTGQYGAIREVLYNAKIINPKIITIAGGGIITSAPEHAMQALEYADYGVIGEAEIIICELHKAIENNENIENVAGIVHKEGTRYKQTIGSTASIDLNSLPLPDYEGFGLDKLLNSVPNVIGMCEYNTVSIITSRSCPYQYTFCFHPSGQKFRQRSLDNVFEEIEYLIKKYNVKYFSISDELFCVNMKRVKEFCRRIKEYNVKWMAQFRVTDVTAELLEMLKDSNCATMGFGIESADNDILKSMKKGITIEQTENALKQVYEAGIGIQGVLIFGDVAETVESAKRTLEWWKKHIHYELQLSLIITYPGTPIYKYAIQNNIIKDPVKFIKDGCPVVRLSKMTDDEYSWLFEQVVSLPRFTHNMPKNPIITNIDYENSNINIEGECLNCGYINLWEKSRLFILETLACRKCGKRHIAPIPEIAIEKIKTNINSLFIKHKNIAFWGINSYFYSLSDKLKLKHENLYYVDKSDVRIGLNIAENKIMPASIIAEKNIDCIIVSVPMYYASIKKAIQDEFPQVKKIISISELLLNEVL